MGKTCVLVVDDERDIRELVCEVLRDDGFDVLEAADGMDALRVLAETATLPGIILLDLQMHGMTGQQFMMAASGLAGVCAIPIVVMTASRDEKNLRSKSVAGAADFLLKPFTPGELIEMVCRHALREPYDMPRALARA